MATVSYVNGTDFESKYYVKDDEESLTNFPKPVNYSFSTVHVPVDIYHEGMCALF